MRRFILLSILFFFTMACGTSPTAFITNTAQPIYRVITRTNINQLVLLHSWPVDTTLPNRSSKIWFSDSNQFIVPTSEASEDGIQSFEVSNFLTTWFAQTGSSQATIVANDQVITYRAGLLFFNKQGEEIETLKANDPCNEGSASHMTDIPGTDLIITGHWHYGDITASYGSSRLLVWDKMQDSCKELLQEFTGGIFSLSASYDGDYISYSVITSTVVTASDQLIAGSTTHIYDMNGNKETCHLVGIKAEFNRQNQLALYDIKKGIINLITPSDCAIQKSFSVDDVLTVITFHPSGDILAGSSGETVEFWDVNSGEKIEEVNIDASEINLPYLGFSPDGRFLVVTKDKSSSTEGQVMLWGIPGN
jgi:hypothetical protein